MKKQKGEVIIAVMFLFIVGISAFAAVETHKTPAASTTQTK